MATTLSNLTRSLFSLIAVAAPLVLGGCVAPTTEVDSEELEGADEDVAHHADAVSGTIAVGSTLKATTDVNFRTGPSTSYSVIRVIATGSLVTVEGSTPQNGFYKVKHNGTVGWTSGQYYTLVSGPPASSSVRDAAITRASEGVGFSYWWGHGRFKTTGPTSSTAGSCSGSCPSCTHSGSYGADCSGFAAKVWQVPSSNTDVSIDSHPYSTVDFNGSNSQWSTVSRSSLSKADALVYNSNGAGHIIIYSSGDGWGSMNAYECKGCSYGCVYNLRTASSSYKGIRKTGW